MRMIIKDWEMKKDKIMRKWDDMASFQDSDGHTFILQRSTITVRAPPDSPPLRISTEGTARIVLPFQKRRVPIALLGSVGEPWEAATRHDF